MTMLRDIFIILVFLVCSIFAKYTYDVKYFNVPLDHFSMTDNRMFSLRYLINDTFWKPDFGPIFFYTGNEGDVEAFAQNTGFLWEAAKKFKALVVFGEHRYYGVSNPNISKADPNYFSYLSSQQALADYVDLIYLLKNHRKSGHHHERHRPSSKRSNPVIAFGGSYGGMLSAWMRMKYPAVIEGALAASAPILQFTGITPCNVYNRVLTNAFNKTSPQCVENIRKSWSVLRNISSEENGREWINKNWKLCDPIKSNDNVSELINNLSGAYSALAMVNYPYATDFLKPLPPNPVKETCKPLSTPLSDDKLLSAVYEAISVYFNHTGKLKCFDWANDPFGGLGAQNWNIQACSEIIMPMCSDGVSDMFEPAEWNFTEYAKGCYDDYKVTSKERYVEKEYGGKDLRYTSNIIFSNGLLDPWSGGGVTENLSQNNIVVVLPDTAHHLDLRGENPADPSSVVRARKLYMNIFRKWIRNYRKKPRAADNE